MVHNNKKKKEEQEEKNMGEITRLYYSITELQFIFLKNKNSTLRRKPLLFVSMFFQFSVFDLYFYYLPSTRYYILLISFNFYLHFLTTFCFVVNVLEKQN